jgi:DNA-binding MurR/RpiR family transcriptional regulator
MNIGQRIDRFYGDLTPQEQRVADFILDHLDDLAVYNASELARLSGVSKATVSRLFRRLGFQDSAEVRAQARALRSEGAPVGGPGAAAGTPSGLLSHAQAEADNLARLLAFVQDGRLDDASRLIAAARHVLVVGLRNSFAVALHLRQQLIQSRDGVRLAPQPGQSLGEELIGLGSRDVIVLMGFRRRPAGFQALLSSITALGIPLVLIADSSARRYSDQAACWLECSVDSPSAFDSYATAMSLVNLLATGAMGASVRSSRTRIAEITSVYDDLNELEASW